MDLFEEYYDKHVLDKNSAYGELSRKQVVIEADYLHDSLTRILKYLDNGGTDLSVIKAEAMDGIYESRI